MTLVEAFGGLQLPPFPPDLTSDVQTVFTAQGQLIVGTAPGAGELLAIGPAGDVLTVGGADPSGLEWAAPAATIVPATTVTGPDAFGASAVVGTSLLYARQDHDHGLPANIAPATTVTGPDAFGASAAVGTSLSYARQDHNHGLPANIAPGNGYGITGNTGATPTPAVGLTIQTAAQSGNMNLTTGFQNCCNVALAAGSWVLHAIVNLSTPGAVAANTYATLILGPTSASASGAYLTMYEEIVITTDFARHNVPMQLPLVLASPTTVYLEALVASTAASPTTGGTVTSIIATRIA